VAGREKPRVLVISNLYPPAVLGGYEVECSEVVESMREDYEVVVLTSKEGKRDGVSEPGILRVLEFLPHNPRSKVLAPLYTLRAARLTRQIMREFKPEVAYVWNGARIPQATIRIVELSGIPVAYRVCEHWFGQIYETDFFMAGLRGGRLGGLMRWVNRAPDLRLDVRRPVDASICWNSETMKRTIPVPDTVRPLVERTVIPAVRQSDTFIGLERRPAAEPKIGFVGRVAEEKGVDTVIGALALLRDQGIRATFEIAGVGEESLVGRLRRLATKLGVADQVVWHGRLDTAGLRQMFSELAVMVVPSTWEEPAPLVIVEGALARVPLVCSRVGGIPDMVRDGEEALLYPPGDAVALAAALREAFDDEAATASRTERAFERVQAFRIDRYEENMAEFLRAAIDAADPPAAAAAPSAS
jgi:glycogen(starch) synthase